MYPADSPDRQARMAKMLDEKKEAGNEMTLEKAEKLLDDEEGFPVSINRAPIDGKGLATLFSIVMDLKKREARVRVGRPTDGGQKLMLRI
jgi:isopenicillin-N N-acyltransferase-like protein